MLFITRGADNAGETVNHAHFRYAVNVHKNPLMQLCVQAHISGKKTEHWPAQLCVRSLTCTSKGINLKNRGCNLPQVDDG